MSKVEDLLKSFMERVAMIVKHMEEDENILKVELETIENRLKDSTCDDSCVR